MNQHTPQYEGPERRRSFLSGDTLIPAKWALAAIGVVLGLLGVVWMASGIWTGHSDRTDATEKGLVEQKATIREVKTELSATIDNLKRSLEARSNKSDMDIDAIRGKLDEAINKLGLLEWQLRYLYHDIPQAGPPSGVKR